MNVQEGGSALHNLISFESKPFFFSVDFSIVTHAQTNILDVTCVI